MQNATARLFDTRLPDRLQERVRIWQSRPPMAKGRRQSGLKELAAIGARVRIQELQAEIDRLTRQFGRASRGGAGNDLVEGGSSGASPRRRRLSAAARKRISDAQRARWAKHRAGKNKN